ncbi:MAG: NADH-quinone oxidoreductase subunit J [Phycisphaeraceae bacterium]|nr:NADH-quinone oxidoreductase subunit J [Phycisphaeraceae bacterium]
MEHVLSPIILYAAIAIGAVGVALALPRKANVNPQPLGALIAAAGIGGLIAVLAMVAGDDRPNLFFYVFAFIALGAALRVITHPRPIYSALYFILSILASAGLYLLLDAEFMTFALIIIYAGAILITYLFVIMLATTAPSDEGYEDLEEYDAVAREPVIATGAGFLVLAILTGWLSVGVPHLPPPAYKGGDEALAQLPLKVQQAFDEVGLLEHADGEMLPFDPGSVAGTYYDPLTRQAQLLLADPSRFRGMLRQARARARGEDVSEDADALSPEAAALVVNEPVTRRDGTVVVLVSFPESLRARNIESVGLELIGGHPLTLEMAGIILLLAMLGAVVLARKRIDLEQAEKLAAATGTLGGGHA